MSTNVLWLKTSCMVALLISTGFLLARRGESEITVQHLALSQFPETLGSDWTGHSITIDPQIIETLGAGDFVERMYQHNSGGPPVDFFVGYFPSQRTGVSIHSPKNCLPAAGWAPVQSRHIHLSSPLARQSEVNEYVIQKGDQKQIVIYWYQAHGRLIASEYAAKLYLVLDSMHMNRSDAALVRIITPIVGDEDFSRAERRADQLAGTVLSVLQQYIPS